MVTLEDLGLGHYNIEGLCQCADSLFLTGSKILLEDRHSCMHLQAAVSALKSKQNSDGISECTLGSRLLRVTKLIESMLVHMTNKV